MARLIIVLLITAMLVQNAVAMTPAEAAGDVQAEAAAAQAEANSKMALELPMTYAAGNLVMTSAKASYVPPYIYIRCISRLFSHADLTSPRGNRTFLVTELEIENHGYDEFNVNPRDVKAEVDKVQYECASGNIEDRLTEYGIKIVEGKYV